MISYIGLETLLKEKNIGKTELSSNLGLSTRTVAKIAKGEKLSKSTLNKIAAYLNVTPEYHRTRVTRWEAAGPTPQG